MFFFLICIHYLKYRVLIKYSCKKKKNINNYKTKYLWNKLSINICLQV